MSNYNSARGEWRTVNGQMANLAPAEVEVEVETEAAAATATATGGFPLAFPFVLLSFLSLFFVRLNLQFGWKVK